MTVKPIIRISFAILITFTFSSCGKKWIYFQEKEESSNTYPKSEVAPVPNTAEHILQAGDLIGLTITVAEKDLTKYDGPVGAGDGTPANQFKVGEDSTISHPFLGTVKVGGLTLAQTEQLITDTLSVEYKSPVVRATLNGFRVTFLGEISKPGIQVLIGSHVNIIDAIAMAGDLNPYGDPKNIKIIRNVDGVKKTEILDLTDLDVFKHPFFYLQSNDIVYVGDLPKRVFRENITLITSLVTVVNSIAILSIRLNQK